MGPGSSTSRSRVGRALTAAALVVAAAACGSSAHSKAESSTAASTTTVVSTTSTTSTTLPEVTTTTFGATEYAVADAVVDIRTRNLGLTVTPAQRDCVVGAFLVGATPAQHAAMLAMQSLPAVPSQDALAAAGFAQCLPVTILTSAITSSFQRQHVVDAECTATRFVSSALPRATMWISLLTTVPADQLSAYTAALRAAQNGCG